MHRVLSLSIVAGLVLGVCGPAAAQSRTVSTADMPKPGVSYISGPSAVPERRETVSTLPAVPHFYAGTPAPQPQSAPDLRNDGYNDGGYAYGGAYPPGYGWNDDRDRRGRDGGRNRHDHGYPGDGHDRPPPRGNSTSLAAGSSGGAGGASGVGVKLAPQPPPDTGHHGRWNGNDGGGWNQPPPQLGTGVTNQRGPQPGTGVGTGPQPGTGIPLRQAGWRGYSH